MHTGVLDWGEVYRNFLSEIDPNLITLYKTDTEAFDDAVNQYMAYAPVLGKHNLGDLACFCVQYIPPEGCSAVDTVLPGMLLTMLPPCPLIDWIHFLEPVPLDWGMVDSMWHHNKT